MINSALSSPFSGPNSRFVSIHNGARLRHLARREVPVQVRARRLREHDVVRGVVGAHPPVGPNIFDMWGPGVLSQTPGQPGNSHHARHKTHRHLLFRVCVVVSYFPLSQVGRRPRLRPAAYRVFSRLLCPICRGDAANPLLESAFITHFGCVTTPPLCVFSAESPPLLVYFEGFLRPAQHAHAVCARISNGSPNELFLSTSLARLHGKLCEISFKTHLLGLPWDPSCRRSETSTFGLCKAADVQRSGPGPGGRTREAV